MEPNIDNAAIIERLNSIARVGPTSIDAYLAEVLMNASVQNTKTVVDAYHLQMDGNGAPRAKDLAKFLVDHVVEYTIPRSEIVAAYKQDMDNGTSGAVGRLNQKARGLFTNLTTSGEGGELLIYFLLEKVLKFPQIICKMNLKTNSQVHFHGADGLHGYFDKGSKKLCLYLAESKLHKTYASAVSDCFESIAPFLNNRGGSKATASRDIELVRDHVDLTDGDLQKAILEYFDPNNTLFNRLEFRAACLLGFDVDRYPSSTGRTTDQVKADMLSEHPGWIKGISTQVTNRKLVNFVIHVICLPFPSVESFRQAILEELCGPGELPKKSGKGKRVDRAARPVTAKMQSANRQPKPGKK